jgi:hypothetical protein
MPLHEAHLLEHLEVVERALLEPLLLEEAAFLVEVIETAEQLRANAVDRFLELLARRDVVRARIHRVALELIEDPAADGIDLRDRVHFVAEELDADRDALFVRGEYLDHVSANSERASVKIDVVALVLDVHQPAQQRVPPELFPLDDLDQEPFVRLGRADAVDAAHAGDDDHVRTREQRLRGRVAHAVDLVVDDRVLLDEGVGRRNVRFGLVIVVVADEIVDRVVREQVAHLAVELRGERLVRRDDQRGQLQALDHVRHRERLAAARDPEQRLVALAAIEPADQRLDGLWLIPFRGELASEAELARHAGPTLPESPSSLVSPGPGSTHGPGRGTARCFHG